jgi:hypothetical protein
MAYPEPRYHKQETAKEYTRQDNLDKIDSIMTRQSDGMLGYISAGEFATTGSNIFDGGQIIDGNLTIIGDIYANEFLVTTSSTEHFTASTNFGLDSGDIHSFTGSVKITGSLDVIGSTNSLGNTIISGGIYVSGGINGQINATNGVISSSAQITSFGFVSGSYETTGRNIISSSAQITSFGFISSSQTINTGSLATTGSNTFIGNQTVTGSFLVSGSTTQIGNNTLIGNTVLSGSIEVSGSFTGSLEIDGDVNLKSPHSFYRWGNKLFNYGAFYDTRTQSGSLNVSQSIQFNSTDYSEGVSIVSGSRVTLQNVGVYNIQFSAQLVDTAGGDSTIRIWIKKNGQNVPNSAGRIFLKANQETIASWNYVVPATSPNDYYELVWQSTDDDARILYEPASGNYPAIPSIILTVTQVA